MTKEVLFTSVFFLFLYLSGFLCNLWYDG